MKPSVYANKLIQELKKKLKFNDETWYDMFYGIVQN